MLKPEIQIGSLVDFDTKQENPEITTRIRQYQSAYRSRLPFKVINRDEHHVILNDRDEQVIYFGSTADPRFHICHVMLKS